VSTETAERCTALIAALPPTLGQDRKLPRRVTTGGAAGRAAAWGDPTVTLVCGTPPADPTAEQVQLGPPDGGIVTFGIQDLGPATAFTTVGLAVPVTVTVPDAYDSTLLVPVTGPLLAADR